MITDSKTNDQRPQTFDGHRTEKIRLKFKKNEKNQFLPLREFFTANSEMRRQKKQSVRDLTDSIEDVEQIMLRMTEPEAVALSVDWFLKPDLLSYPKFGTSVCKCPF